jgi:hypothetical protein
MNALIFLRLSGLLVIAAFFIFILPVLILFFDPMKTNNIPGWILAVCILCLGTLYPAFISLIYRSTSKKMSVSKARGILLNALCLIVLLIFAYIINTQEGVATV